MYAPVMYRFWLTKLTGSNCQTVAQVDQNPGAQLVVEVVHVAATPPDHAEGFIDPALATIRETLEERLEQGVDICVGNVDDGLDRNRGPQEGPEPLRKYLPLDKFDASSHLVPWQKEERVWRREREGREERFVGAGVQYAAVSTE